MNELTHVLNDPGKSLPGRTELLSADFDRDGLQAALRESSLAIIPSSDGEISTVSQSGDPNDNSRQTGFFDLHQDGLYYPTAPHFLLLYCEDAGRGDSPTVVADTRPVVEEIDRRPDLQVLREVELVYRGKSGDEHSHPLLESHPLTKWRVLNLGARAYVRSFVKSEPPGAGATLREVVSAMAEVFRLLDGAVVRRHFWKKGDILLIDNHTFVHGREAKSLDFQRKLLRVWLSVKDRGQQ
jgi:alpha-ketoglutarate-dependent taurine dioxygenase